MAAVLIGTCSRLRALTQSKRPRSVFLCKWWSPRAHRLSFASEFCCTTSENAGSSEELEMYEGPVPRDKLSVSFSRSSGPGGQNVNKVNTKVDVRFHVDSAEWVPERVKERLKTMFKPRINKAGELVLSSQRFRSQHKNLEDAISKLDGFLREASEVPRGPSQLTLARIRVLKKKSERRRLTEKKYHSHKKSSRRTNDL